jgi:hypothetical protein
LNRVFLTRIHLLLAAFLFPAILMFLATGALYTWGQTGKVTDTKLEVAIPAPLNPEDEAGMRALALAELGKAGLAPPSGKSRIRKAGDAFTYEWTGSRRDITIEPGSAPNLAKVTIKEASLHRTFVQLHKAKGGTVFKVYATILAVALLLLVLTGLIIGWMTPAWRSTTKWASLAGVLAFAGMVALG